MELYALNYLGAALLALLVMLLPALAHKEHWNVIRESWWYPLRRVFGFVAEELGAITTAYWTRGAGVMIRGSATPATATQAQQVTMQKALITFGVLGDAQATFTHNWGLDISAPEFHDPEILWDLISTGLTTYTPLVTFDRSNTNVVYVNKTGGDGCVINVTLRRPHSLGL
jgi:hypothetical protein